MDLHRGCSCDRGKVRERNKRSCQSAQMSEAQFTRCYQAKGGPISPDQTAECSGGREPGQNLYSFDLFMKTVRDKDNLLEIQFFCSNVQFISVIIFCNFYLKQNIQTNKMGQLSFYFICLGWTSTYFHMSPAASIVSLSPVLFDVNN